MPALDHRLLRQFLAVAEAGTVRAAALHLHMSQPPLTAAIRQLEERIGVTLFERSVKGMRLTAAGDMLSKEARQILGQLEHIERRVKFIGGNEQPLRIGFVSAALNGPLPALLRGIRRSGSPSPKLFEMTTPEQLDGLTEGRIDLGLLHPPMPAAPDFTIHPLGQDPFWAALPDDHPLTDRDAICFAEIASEPFVLFPRSQGPVLYDKISEIVASHGYNLNIAVEARRIHSQLSIIAGGLGVGLIPKSTALMLTFRGVRSIPLIDTVDDIFLELVAVGDAEILSRFE